MDLDTMAVEHETPDRPSLLKVLLVAMRPFTLPMLLLFTAAYLLLALRPIRRSRFGLEVVDTLTVEPGSRSRREGMI